MTAYYTEQRLKFRFLVDLTVRDVREVRAEPDRSQYEHRERVNYSTDDTHLASSIAIRLVVCFVGFPQIGGPFNGTYVVTVMPQFGHFHFPQDTWAPALFLRLLPQTWAVQYYKEATVVCTFADSFFDFRIIFARSFVVVPAQTPTSLLAIA